MKNICFLLQKVYKLLREITTGYNLAVRPSFYKNATSVGIELYVMGIPTVDDENMELSLDMYFRQVSDFSQIFYFVTTLYYT